MWLAVTSMLAWLGFAGPGIGSGLINALGKAAAHDDVEAMRRHTSTAVLTVLVVAVILAGCLITVSTWSGLPALLGISDRADLERDARALVVVMVALLSGTLAMDFLAPLCAGLQEGYLTAWALIAGNLTSLAAVGWLAMSGGDVVRFALAIGLPPIAANAALAAYVFLKRHRDLRPTWRLWKRDSLTSLMTFGGWMFAGYICDLIILQSANVLIANRFGPGEVPRYAVPASIMLNIAGLCYGVVHPYWPAITEASVRQDWSWIRGTIVRTLRITTMIMAPAAVGLVVAGQWFIGVWAGPHAVPSQALLAAVAVYSLLMVWGGNMSVLLLGLGRIKTKIPITMAVAAAHVIGFIALSPSLGPIAFPVAGSAILLCECIATTTIGFRHLSTGAREVSYRQAQADASV
jgi:O-antigen/teichoic acid export membrane protein